MKDIRPAPKHNKDKKTLWENVPNEEMPNVPKRPSLEQPAPVKKPAFRSQGTSVPVSSLNVSPSSKKASTAADKPPLMPAPSRLKPTKKAASSKRALRLGTNERKLVALLAMLVLIAGGLFAYLLLPSADITLHLQTAPLFIDQTLHVSSSASEEPADIPGTIYTREVAVEGVSAVASRTVVGTKATGTARIVNQADNEQAIREQSRLVTADGQLFYMQRHAIVPPNSSASVSIEAAEAGASGNIEPQRLDFAALDASSQSIVYAEVESALTGGTGEEVPVVAESDLEQARMDAAEAARAQVEQEIRAELPQGWLVLEETWTADLATLSTNAEIDEQREDIPYSAQGTVQVMAYEETVLEERLKAALEEQLDENYMLFPGPISFTKSVKSVDWEKEAAQVEVRVTHTTTPTFNEPTLREKIGGRSDEEAREYLETLPGIARAEIELSPFWVQSIPRFEKRIGLEFVSDREL